jgi:hypothetical protein
MKRIAGQVTVGFCEHTVFGAVSETLQSAHWPLVVMMGNPQVRG